VATHVCTRHVSAGITPPPGATSRLTVWWGRIDWLEVEVRGALREHLELCRAHHVAPDTVYAVARAMAGYADARTGRDCRPTNERLVADVRCSLSTVQRARRVLKALGLIVEVTAGRSVLTLAERLAAWERHSSHRAIAAEFVLCSRRDRAPRAVDNRRPDLRIVDRDTPPVGQVVRTSAREISSSLRSTDGTRRAAPRPAHTGKSGPKPAQPADLRARRLALAVKRRVSWVSGVHPQRIERLLLPFACADWTDDDVCLTIRDRLAALGKSVPADLERPWAYLAWLLRGVDPAERPSVLVAAHAAAEREHDRLRRHGAPCEHGVPGGDVVSPLTGQRGCPLCRAG
jgi:hypothetical protein